MMPISKSGSTRAGHYSSSLLLNLKIYLRTMVPHGAHPDSPGCKHKPVFYHIAKSKKYCTLRGAARRRDDMVGVVDDVAARARGGAGWAALEDARLLRKRDDARRPDSRRPLPLGRRGRGAFRGRVLRAGVFCCYIMQGEGAREDRGAGRREQFLSSTDPGNAATCWTQISSAAEKLAAPDGHRHDCCAPGRSYLWSAGLGGGLSREGRLACSAQILRIAGLVSDVLL